MKSVKRRYRYHIKDGNIKIYHNDRRNNIYENIIALFIAWSIQLLILLGGKTISSRLGNKPLDALESLMGLLLTVVAVSMIIDNINQIYGIG